MRDIIERTREGAGINLYTRQLIQIHKPRREGGTYGWIDESNGTFTSCDARVVDECDHGCDDG